MIAEGLGPDEAYAVALDFDRAAHWFGRWTDQRAEATILVPDTRSAKARSRPMREERKYKTLQEILGNDAEGRDDERGPLVDGVPLSDLQDEADERLARDLLKDRHAIAEFLRVTR